MIGLVPWVTFGWAVPERHVLSPLLENVEEAFGLGVRVLFADVLLLVVVVAVVLLVLLGASLLVWTRGRRFASTLLFAGILIGATQLVVVVLGVREMRAHTLPEDTATCACPEALASLERTICACDGEQVVAQISLERDGARTTFVYDDAGAVVSFRLDARSGPVRTCTLDPPQPIDRIASAVLRCTAP